VAAEEALDSLGADPSARRQAAHQLIYDGLMEPTKHIVMPDSLGGRIRFEHRQMDTLGEITPIVRQSRRVASSESSNSVNGPDPSEDEEWLALVF